MFSIVYCELLKLRRSKMLWLVLIGALLPAALNYFVSLHQLEGRQPYMKWDSMFETNLTMMTILMCPALFALFAGYLFAREYQERTINSYLTVPRSRTLLLLSKYLVMIPIMMATLILAFLLTLVSGWLLKHDLLTAVVLWKYVGLYAILLLMEFALISSAAMISILGKTYIPAMGLGIFAVISELTVMQSKYVMHFPWSAPTGIIFHLTQQSGEDLNVAAGIYTLLLAFILPLLFNLWYYRKADVHSG